MALVGNMIAMAVGGNPSIVNYVMFTAVFSMGSLIYLTAATISDSFVIAPIIPIVVDALNLLFFFIGGIALAAYMGVHSCGDTVCLITLFICLEDLSSLMLTITGLRQQQYRHLRLVR
jgi:hypothetical protein